MKSKKGQSQNKGGSAATFIFVLGFILILYILFLPPEDRQDLLGIDSDGNGNGYDKYELNETLITVNSLHLDYLSMDNFEHNVPPFYLFVKTESKELFSQNAFYVKNNWFSSQDKKINFNIENPDKIEDVKMSFNSKTRNGRLKILFNGVVVLEEEIGEENVGPIEIDEELIEAQNELVFGVSDTGAKFWETNEYAISQLKIIGKVSDTSQQQSSNIITLSKEEIDNLEEATLKFFPNCQLGDAGVLRVYMNGNTIVSQVPDCGILNMYNVPESYLHEGQNTLTFKSEKGSYLIDQLKLETELEEETYPLYYFDLTDDMYDDIQDGDALVNFSVEFVDDNEYEDKIFDLSVNGHITRVDTDENNYYKIFYKDWLEEGTNYIKIIPKSTVDIVQMRLKLDGEDYEVDDDDDDKRNCIDKYRKECYRGDVWWYSSCDERTYLAFRCANDEECDDGRCVEP